jgi:hypothetical protein
LPHCSLAVGGAALSDDGTKAAKQIAYSIQLEGVLAQADYLAKQLDEFHWSDELEGFLKSIHTAVDRAWTDARTLTKSFYKVIGEGG